MKNISIIGSTGSIGTQALEVIRNHSERFSVAALVAHNNIELLKKQVTEFKPRLVGVTSDIDCGALKDVLPYGSELITGEKALIAASRLEDADTVVVSVVGASGLRAVVNALKCGKNVALANKEALVVGGNIIMDIARNNNSQIMPVDSEHSAVFQCLQSGKREDLKRIILTCSGGAFRDLTMEELKFAKAKDALRHPNWNMGKKITIDCATLMNKGLEIIEARYLFDFTCIDYILHKESIIHSMVEFNDNTVIANLSYPTMELPIQYALSYPERLPAKVKSLDFAAIKSLSFSEIDTVRFPCIKIAQDALREGEGATTILNAANEIAVKLYLSDCISFNGIPEIVLDALEHISYVRPQTVDDLLYIDFKTREYISKVYKFEETTC